jgi:hypothetical protein
LLLAAVLICLCSLGRAQEAPAADTVVIPSFPDSAAVQYQDEEVNEEEEDAAEEILSPSLRSVPDSTVKRIKADPALAYANDPEYWAELQRKRKEPEPKKETEERDMSMLDFSGFFGAVKIVFIILLAAMLGFIIYKLMGNRWPWEKEARLVEEEAVNEEDLDVDELQQKIREAIGNRKYRMAIRYSYLFTLRRLDEKGWIRLDARSTNHDYVKQMKERDPHGTFAWLTNVYDYVWYGEFELNEEQFNLVYKDFQKYLNTYSH